MEHHHDNHHPEGNKPVSFTVPLIMASALLFIIVLLLSVCDPKHGGCECKEDCSKECMEACEKGDHGNHDEHGNEIKKGGAHNDDHSSTEEHHGTPADSTVNHETATPKDTTVEHHGH